MSNSSKQQENNSFSLFEHDEYLPSSQIITNFNRKQSPVQKKIGISPWFQDNNEEVYAKTICVSPIIQNQRHRMINFLSAIRTKNNNFRSKMNKKLNKNINSNNAPQQQSPQHFKKDNIFLHLNSTMIAFPKSKSLLNEHYQNEQKILLEKLYKKRQKSKVIPKELVINTNYMNYPIKDSLMKNKSFVVQRVKKETISNPESFGPKKISFRRRFMLQSEEKNPSQKFQKRMQTKNLEFVKKAKNFKGLRKLNSLNIDKQIQSPPKHNKTFYSGACPHMTDLEELCIAKIKEEAKISHLNRVKSNQKAEIQLMGSTIAHWKNLAQRKLNKPQMQIE